MCVSRVDVSWMTCFLVGAHSSHSSKYCIILMSLAIRDDEVECRHLYNTLIAKKRLKSRRNALESKSWMYLNVLGKQLSKNICAPQ